MNSNFPLPPKSQSLDAQSGVMLIEVLVAVFIFAIGVLGIVGLQAQAAKVNVDARFRTEAAALADEYASKILLEPDINAATLSSMQGKFASPSGTVYQDWVDNRLQAAGSGLPGSAATVEVSQPNVCSGCGFVVKIVLTFRPPGQDDESQHVTRLALPGA
jgi:type IV pilus assembly protein PilV